jgi:hypothetical protein
MCVDWFKGEVDGRVKTFRFVENSYPYPLVLQFSIDLPQSYGSDVLGMDLLSSFGYDIIVLGLVRTFGYANFVFELL